MHIVILAGGVGSRLWPRSRQTLPKQFADIAGVGRTMIQSTFDRLEGLVDATNVWIVTGEAYANLAVDQLPEVPRDQILVEPEGRNTAPAIAWAVQRLAQQDPNAIVAVLSADHYMADDEAFRAALRSAESIAADGWLVTLGVPPTFPHTGYGYIRRGKPIVDGQGYAVERFLEKPDLPTAEALLAAGDCYWNGGIFVFRVAQMLAEIERQQPQLAAALAQMGSATTEADFLAAWRKMPSISVDYAIMEGAQRVAVTPLDAGWNDVGSWDALETLLPADSNGNFASQANVLALDASGNTVVANKRIVALIEVDDLVIVEQGDALLIGHKSQMQRVKEVVERLKSTGKDDLL
jgi:mannose-1-phosphate guanylyltransferase/mannose-6-phosphate isomerase